MEETSMTRNSRGSTSSRSDSSYDYEPMANKSHPSSRRCFMPKAIHPLSSRETNTDTTLQRDGHSSSSNLNFSESPDLYHDPANRFWCSICKRLLSQRSPWGSRRIIKSRDMPITGVLACCHVFHAECLDQTTPKSNRNDPQCPVCAIDKEESCPKSRNVMQKPWGCVQAGDCIEGALSRNALVSVKFRKNLSGQDFNRKLM